MKNLVKCGVSIWLAALTVALEWPFLISVAVILVAGAASSYRLGCWIEEQKQC